MQTGSPQSSSCAWCRRRSGFRTCRRRSTPRTRAATMVADIPTATDHIVSPGRGISATIDGESIAVGVTGPSCANRRPRRRSAGADRRRCRKGRALHRWSHRARSDRGDHALRRDEGGRRGGRRRAARGSRLRTVLPDGRHSGVTERVADSLGIPEVRAGVLPTEGRRDRAPSSGTRGTGSPWSATASTTLPPSPVRRPQAQDRHRSTSP